jgi:hypothetical protein
MSRGSDSELRGRNPQNVAGEYRPLKVWTARYTNPTLAAHPAGKVRITLGAPRFRLPYELAGTILELAPTWSMLHRPEQEFTEQYVSLLEQRGGIPFFGDRFAQVAAAAGVDELVLLCYENLTKPGLFCHRRVFAEWWLERSGRTVEELPEGQEQLEL